MRKVLVSILILMLTIFILIGCSKYERNTSGGAFVETKLDEVIKMAGNKDSFVVIFTLTTCEDCIKLKKIMTSYLKTHGVKIKEVVLDNEGTSAAEIQSNRDKINTIFKSFKSTPSMYYVEKGQVVDEIMEVKEESELDAWIVKNKLDAK